jgi:hypothetical protein
MACCRSLLLPPAACRTDRTTLKTIYYFRQPRYYAFGKSAARTVEVHALALSTGRRKP